MNNDLCVLIGSAITSMLMQSQIQVAMQTRKGLVVN